MPIFLEDSQCMSPLQEKFDRKIPVLHINELLGIMLGNEDLIPIINESHIISIQSLLEKITDK